MGSECYSISTFSCISTQTYNSLSAVVFCIGSMPCVGPRERHFRKRGKALTIYITELAFVLQNDENTVSQ